MRRKLISVLLGILMAGFAIFAVAQGGGVKPPKGSIPFTLTFVNQPGSDNPGPFTAGDDGLGPYVDQNNGLRCELDTNTGNFFFDLNFFKYSGPRREAWLNLNYPVEDGVPALGSYLTSDFFFDAEGLLTINTGETVITGGAFMIPINGKYCHFYLYNANGHQGSGLSVTRTSDTQWIMEMPNGSIGDLWIPNKKGILMHYGLYYVNFKLQIDQR